MGQTRKGIEKFTSYFITTPTTSTTTTTTSTTTTTTTTTNHNIFSNSVYIANICGTKCERKTKNFFFFCWTMHGKSMPVSKILIT